VVEAYPFIAFTVCQAEKRLYASIGGRNEKREKGRGEFLRALLEQY
jgi:hypothetical protein